MDGFSGTGKSNSPLSEAKGHIVYPFLRKKVLHKIKCNKVQEKKNGKNRAFSMAKHWIYELFTGDSIRSVVLLNLI